MSNQKDFRKIKIPARRKKINIYCDFETFYYTDGYPLWEHLDEEGFSNVLAKSTIIVPWLLGVNAPNINSYTIKGKRVAKLGDYSIRASADYPHESFFLLLKEYWEGGFTPVVWFHNTSYDLRSAYETAFRENDPDLIGGFYAKQDGTFLRGMMESPKYGFKCEFGDTLLYRRMSLAKAGEMFGSPKGSIPYTMMDLQVINDRVLYTD